MTAEEIKTAADDLRRRRVTCPLIRSQTWYRNLPEWIRVEVEELLGICVGNGPVTPETYCQAQHLAKTLVSSDQQSTPATPRA